MLDRRTEQPPQQGPGGRKSPPSTPGPPLPCRCPGHAELSSVSHAHQRARAEAAVTNPITLSRNNSDLFQQPEAPAEPSLEAGAGTEKPIKYYKISQLMLMRFNTKGTQLKDRSRATNPAAQHLLVPPPQTRAARSHPRLLELGAPPAALRAGGVQGEGQGQHRAHCHEPQGGH